MRLLALGDTAGPGALLVASAVVSAVTDNIPLAAMLAKILAGIPGIADNPSSPFWWAVVFGANLGGNITPIGSASTLVAVTIIHKHGLSLSFVGFVKKALPFAAVHILLALLYVLGVLGVLAATRTKLGEHGATAGSPIVDRKGLEPVPSAMADWNRISLHPLTSRGR